MSTLWVRGKQANTKGEKVEGGLENAGRLENGSEVLARSLHRGKSDDNHETAHGEANGEFGRAE